MAQPENAYVKLPKSVRALTTGSRDMGNVAPDEEITVTVQLRPRTPLAVLTGHVAELAVRAPGARRHLDRAEFAAMHGASQEDVEKVMDFAHEHGLSVADVSPGRRSVQLVGTAENLAQAFQTELKHYQHGKATYRCHTDHLHVPAALAGSIEAVFGFDTRPYARPHFQIAGPVPAPGAAAHDGAVPHASPEVAHAFNPDDLASVYQFPDGDGTGEVIGIIELSAPDGSGYRAQELKRYFHALKLPTPKVVAVSVDGGRNRPGHDPNDPQNADGEVLLDIEVAGAIAPRAKIVVYFAPNTAQGFVDAISQAVHDAVNKPSVISLSWGSAENPDDLATDQIDQILQAAAAMGVTFCVASGDSGSHDDPNNPDQAAVDFPASSSYALGCGGTRLEVSGTAISNEVVWEGHSGGGVSRHFPLPGYQAGAKVPSAVQPAGSVGRGVPDVAGNADPATGYNILVDGQHLAFGGTSAVAPLWAGLVARLNQKLGHPVGFLNPILYQHPEVFHDITSGSNGAYQAGAGWDPCTGLGSPNGTKLLAVLTAGSTGRGAAPDDAALAAGT